MFLSKIKLTTPDKRNCGSVDDTYTSEAKFIILPVMWELRDRI